MLKPLVVVLAMLAVPGVANAATVHTPADGLITEQGQPVYFDWAWDSDEYATASIVLTRSSDPASPLWHYGPTVPASADRQVFSDCSYGVCSPWLDSHATLRFATTAPGDWWWRLCNKSINGEDDKCSYDAGVAPRKLTITAKPPPPPDLCADGLDNDGDGKTDLDDMDNEAASDIKLWCDQVKPTPKSAPPQRSREPLPRLTVNDAMGYIRTALKRRFGNAYRYAQGKKISRCDRRSRTKVWCRVEFFAGDVGWDGRTRIWYSYNRWDVAIWNYSYKITRTNYYCLDVGNSNCRKTFRVR